MSKKQKKDGNGKKATMLKEVTVTAKRGKTDAQKRNAIVNTVADSITRKAKPTRNVYKKSREELGQTQKGKVYDVGSGMKRYRDRQSNQTITYPADMTRKEAERAAKGGFSYDSVSKSRKAKKMGKFMPDNKWTKRK